MLKCNQSIVSLRVPENPKDTPDTNALMRVEQQVPAYNEISPKKLQTGFQKLHVLHDTAVDHLLTQLKTGLFVSLFVSLFI